MYLYKINDIYALTLGTLHGLSKFGTGYHFTFSYLWTILLWGVCLLTSLSFLIYLMRLKERPLKKKHIIVAIFIAAIPVFTGKVLVAYYTQKAIEMMLLNTF